MRSRGVAAKPRNRSLARALYRFSAGAHLQACLHVLEECARCGSWEWMGSARASGRQDWLRPSCALPRGRYQAEKPLPGEGALSFFCWRPFASTLAWTPTKKRLRLSSQPFLGLAERTRFELAVELPLRQFSKLLVSATHPPLRKHAESIFSIATAKVMLFFIPASVLAEIFSKKT